jgi:HlyD family secretion protein
MKRIWIAAVVILVLAGTGWYFLKHKSKKEVTNPYEFTTIKQGDLLNTVSATGTLEAVGTVTVSTQVSGTLDKVLVDYNDVVKKGQILAIIDQKSLKTAYEEATATYSSAQASLRLAQSDYDTQSKYRQQGLGTDYELLQAEVSLEKAKAQVIMAKSSLDKADLNLNTYSIIRAPIDGKILSKSVEEGTTVAASFSAPTLFTIARDLSKMEIHANVDESDIGQIKKGQKVTFTVEAYPDSEFTGVVKDVYLNAEVISNVVNYTVVVKTTNPKLTLLPGMTATCEFIISGKENVRYVDNVALSVSLTEEMLTELKKSMTEQRKQGGSGMSGQSGPRSDSSGQHQGMSGSMTNSQSGSSMSGEAGLNRLAKGKGAQSDSVKVLYYIDSKNTLHMAPVKIGISDGTYTEINPIREIPSDAKIIKKATGTKVDNDGPPRHAMKLL